MWFGPIHSVMAGTSVGFSPVKSIQVQSTSGKVATLFGKTFPHGLGTDVQSFTAESVLLEADPATTLMRVHQMEELIHNQEWSRAGFYIQWREDGTNDGEDGWYVPVEVDISEEFIYSAYGEPKIVVELRQRFSNMLGAGGDKKLMPNDANITTGISMIAYPQGGTSPFSPAVTYNFVSADGSTIGVVENPSGNLHMNLTSPTATMANGRCQLLDQAT